MVLRHLCSLSSQQLLLSCMVLQSESWWLESLTVPQSAQERLEMGMR